LYARYDDGGSRSAEAKSRSHPDLESREAIVAHLCRCTGDMQMVEAVQAAAEMQAQ
jgi:aerobic-type carbon monoxide dehydrogenase small subunit (CoxS/CutS family)